MVDENITRLAAMTDRQEKEVIEAINHVHEMVKQNDRFIHLGNGLKISREYVEVRSAWLEKYNRVGRWLDNPRTV